eukprot:gene8733-18049_t
MSTASFTLCYFPFLIDFGPYSQLRYLNQFKKDVILSSSQTLRYRDAVLVNAALSVPVAIEFLLDFSSKLHKLNGNGFSPRAVLIASIMVPSFSLILLLEGNQVIELGICIFVSRLALLFYGILGHIWEQVPAIRSKWYILAVLLSGLIYNENYGIEYLTLCTYAEAALTIGLTILQRRLDRYDVNQKDHMITDLKRNFIRYISHEVRSPLNAIHMGLALVRTDIEQHEDTEANNKQITIDFPLNHSENSHSHRINIDSQSPLHDCTINIDLNQITQVFKTLISYALTFSPAGSTVKITAAPITLDTTTINNSNRNRNNDNEYEYESSTRRMKYLQIEIIDAGI